MDEPLNLVDRPDAEMLHIYATLQMTRDHDVLFDYWMPRDPESAVQSTTALISVR